MRILDTWCFFALAALGCGAAPTAPGPVPDAAPLYHTYEVGAKYRGEQAGGGALGHTIRYFTDAERAALEVKPCGPKLCDLQGKPLDPEVATHPERGGTMLYVMTGDGRFYGTFDGKLNVLHHSSINQGKPVASAGEMLLIEGELMEIDNSSGHYKPPPEALDQAVTQLRKLGVDLSRTKITYFGLPDRAPPTN